jgi:hypothetical protein
LCLYPPTQKGAPKNREIKWDAGDSGIYSYLYNAIVGHNIEATNIIKVMK